MARVLGVPIPKRVPPRLLPPMRDLLLAQGKAEMTDRELADRAGYAYQNVANWRAGRGTPTVTVLADFAQVLGLEVRLVPKGNGDE